MILERISRFFHKPERQEKDAAPCNGVFEVGITLADTGHGFFANATNFTIQNAHMVDRSQIIQTIHNTITAGTTALDRLLPYTCPDAAVDSSARHPPPRCHPGTRQRILDTLNNWLINPLWKMFWLSGPAGTGKSAVAQSFAEACFEQGRLGAAYFFFRSSGRDDPQPLIPSLAYQLAVNVPDYGNLLGHAIARDPSIFHKTTRVQLRRLIIEPFSLLQEQGHEIIQAPPLIILDGLDECKGIVAHCEIVEMIGEVIRLKKDLPLLWFIASRPEPHLQYIFSRADFSIGCSKEMLLIDADTRDDVDRYLRDSFDNIRTRYSLMVAWPSEVQMWKLQDIASGLFILAATIVRYVSDIEYGDPVRRLTEYFAFMSNMDRAGTTNPLQTLDQLYSQILSEIPEDVYSTTKRILDFHFVLPADFAVSFSCSFLRIDQSVFHDAVKKLHSLLDIPPRDAGGKALRVHHTSFRDYLWSQPRSGKFHISVGYTGNHLSLECLFWYKTMFQDYRWVSDDSFVAIVKSAEETILPGVVLDGVYTSQSIRMTVGHALWQYLSLLRSQFTAELLNELEGFDFRYMLVNKRDEGHFSRCIESWSCHTAILHSTPQDQLEETLLDKAVSEVSRPIEPAVFPMVHMNSPEHPYRYIFIGHGIRSCLFWFDEACALSGRCRLSCKVQTKETYAISDCVVHLAEDF